MATKDKDRETDDVEETDGDALSAQRDDGSDDDGAGDDGSDDDDSDDDGSDDDGSDDDGSDDEDPNDGAGDDDSDDDAAEVEPAEEGGATPAELGATRYVHAALFAAGILIAYLAGKLLGGLWNTLAEWPAAVEAVPSLLAYSEDDRPNFTMGAGALIGAITVIQIYRKPHIRGWADEVAQELAKVTWPNKQTVTDGTIVVVVASIIATAYIAVLDRFWGFITGLVYGA